VLALQAQYPPPGEGGGVGVGGGAAPRLHLLVGNTTIGVGKYYLRTKSFAKKVFLRSLDYLDNDASDV
jgi:hypothetical protein